MVKDIIAKFLKDLLFPAFCLGCGYEGTFLCPDCMDNLEKKALPPGFEKTDLLDGISSVFRYEEKSLPAKLIHSFKYDFITELEAPLGKLLTRHLSASLTGSFRITDSDFPDNMLICPVPLHKKRYRWRGFNQSELLAEQAGMITGLPVCDLLARTSFSRPQMELNKEERLRNVKGAFILLAEADVVSGRTVLLVDDVATTLATLHECALALKKGGAKKVYAIVLARTG